ncbi:ABC transporter substrate-binding protein [Natrialba sp. PRR66]|nr:ABC transporter substrate-binding protein [Natrialba sp. PRR66]
MSGNDSTLEGPTRRDALKYGGTLVTGSVLAGCSDLIGRDDDPQQSESGRSYEACIEPTGCLSFEEVPERYAVYNGGWADMAFALGQREGFLTAGNMIPEFLFEPFGLDVPTQEGLPAMWAEDSWDKESFYEIDPDVFLIDPEYLHGVGWDANWDEEDTAEIIENVAPFFGNNMRRRREFHDYELYSLYEGFERLADLFQERERYEAFAEIHDELRSEIQSRLPPESERPRIGLINGGSDPTAGQFYPLYARSEGYEMKPYRDLDVRSAFSRDNEDGGQIGYERLIEIDPDIILVHWGIGTTGETNRFSASAFREQYVAPMEEDAIGSQLTAVQEGAVYPGQYGEQGPIVNLLQTEMTAQQLYPEAFGAFDPESFPEVPETNQLFDRQAVAEIIAGDR